MDERGTISMADPAAAALLGREREDLLGQDIAGVLCPLSAIVAASGEQEHVVVIDRPDGRSVRLECSVSYVGADVAETGTGPHAVVLRDVPPPMAPTPDRDRMYRLASIGAAVPSLVHKVKNSLATVTIGLELLEEDLVGADSSSRLRGLLAEARMMVMMLDGFRGAAGNLRSPVAADLGPILNDARMDADELADHARVHLEWLVDELPPLAVDAAVLHCLVYGLIADALIACEAGDSVHVAVRLHEGALVIEVGDSVARPVAEAPPGRPALFAVPKGGGFGRALVREVVESDGGSLAVTHPPHMPTLRTVRIPDAWRPRSPQHDSERQV